MKSIQWTNKSVKATKIFEAIMERIGNWEIVWERYKNIDKEKPGLLDLIDELMQTMLQSEEWLDYLGNPERVLWKDKFEMLDKIGKVLEKEVLKGQ